MSMATIDEQQDGPDREQMLTLIHPRLMFGKVSHVVIEQGTDVVLIPDRETLVLAREQIDYILNAWEEEPTEAREA